MHIKQTIECPACGKISQCRCVGFFQGEETEYSLYRCPKCGLLFVHPVPLFQEHFHNELSQQAEGHWEVSEPVRNRRIKTIEKILDTLSPEIQPPMKIIDFACGYGELLECASKRGFRCAGVDISAGCREYIHKHLPDVSVCTAIEQLPQEFASVDCVMMCECLYYLPNPAEVLKELQRRLKPGGKLFVIASINRGWVLSFLSVLHGGPLHLKKGGALLLNLLNNTAYYGFTTRSLRSILLRSGFGNFISYHFPGPQALPCMQRMVLKAWQGMANSLRWIMTCSPKTDPS